MKFRDFEIRPTTYLDGHTETKHYDVVKWQTHDPYEVTDFITGEKKMLDRSCFSIAHIYWNEKESCWEFESVGTRFLKYCEDGLCEYILKWLELHDLCEKYKDE